MIVEKTESVLHTASRHDNVELVAVLLRSGLDINIKDGLGRTPLHSAVSGDSLEVVKILIDKKETNINSQDKLGRTPLMVATNLVMPEICDLHLPRSQINLSDNWSSHCCKNKKCRSFKKAH
jgi:hypothetical protein